MNKVYSGEYLDYLLDSTENETVKVGDCYLENVDGVFKLLGWNKPFTGRLHCSNEQLMKLHQFRTAFGKKIDLANIVVDRQCEFLKSCDLYTSSGEPFAYVDLSEFENIEDFIQKTYKSTRNRIKRWYADIKDNYKVVMPQDTGLKQYYLDVMMEYNKAKFGEESMYHEYSSDVYALMYAMGDKFKVLAIVSDNDIPVYVTCFMECGEGTIVHHNSGTILDNLGRIGWLFVFDWCIRNGFHTVEEMCYYAPYKETMGCKFTCSIQMTNDLDIYRTFNTPCDLLGKGDYEVWCNRRDEPTILKTNAFIDKKLMDSVFRKLQAEKYELGTVMVFKDGVHIGSVPVTTNDNWETCISVFPLKNAPKNLFVEDEELVQALRKEIRIDTKGLGISLSYGI